MSEGTVLIIGDEPMRHHLTRLLRGCQYTTAGAGSLEEAGAVLARERVLITLVDLAVVQIDGDQLRAHGEPGRIIAICEKGDPLVAPKTDMLEADDVLEKPIDSTGLQRAIETLLPRPAPSAAAAGEEAWARLSREVALWRSPKMRLIWEVIQQAARVDVTVLVCGETGTGKDVVARAIHHLSERHAQPFVKVNCAAVPRELLESELFGHERGSFTGAHQLRIGKFESANRGTVFLDEIGDLHPALQAKLLHVLQDGAFSRVGGKSTIKVDVRVLAATNKDLERAVQDGRFREDLYYRLNVIQIVVPPLRERSEEIPHLVDYFVSRYAKLFNRQGFRPDPGAMDRLARHRYPGNVRELENIIKRMIVLSDPFLVRTPLSARADVDEPVPPGPGASPSLKDIARGAAREAERDAIVKALEQTNWNRVRAAKLLRISYRALLYKIKDAGLHKGPGPGAP